MNRTLSRLSRVALDPTHASDGRLLDAFVGGGDGPAFEGLVRRHGPMVLAVCRRVLRHQQDAEDAFQATFLVLARRAADVWPRDAVGAWLYGVAYRVALKARTTRARRTGREQALDDAVHPAVTDPAAGDLMDALDRAIRKLPEVYRAAVVACDLEGRTRKAAAEHLGWKEGTLSGRLARARDLLAARLRRLGLALPAGGVAGVLGTAATADAVSRELFGRVAAFGIGNQAVGVSAPVAALTEGVVRTMYLAKIKAAALVAVMAAGMIGYGAWAAGPGDGPGGVPGQSPPGKPEKAAAKPVPAPPPTDPVKTPGDRAKEKGAAAEPAPRFSGDLALLQGWWQIESFGSTKAGDMPEKDRLPPIEIRGATFYMPFRNTSIGWERQVFKIALDPTRTPKAIDLISPDKPVAYGIYEFEYGPGAKPGDDPVTLRLALGSARPAGFATGGGGIETVRLVRVAAAKPGPRADLARREAQGLLQELEAAQGKLDPATLDKFRGRVRAIDKLLDDARPDLNAKPLKDILPHAARDRQEVDRLLLEQLKRAADEAAVELDAAKAGVAAAEQRLQLAKARAEEVRARVAAAAAGPAATISVHVRTPIASEKVQEVKVAAADTVLDALTATVGKELKPAGVSVWVVRDGKVLPVDFAGLTTRGETATNYQLRAGDRVFVQVNVGK